MLAYERVVNYSLTACATDAVISGNVCDIHYFNQDPSISATIYLGALWTNVFRCGQVFDEVQLQGMVINGHQPSILHSLRVYCKTNKKASMKTSQRHVDAVHRLLVEMAHAEDVDRQRKPNRRSRGKTRPVLFVQSNRTTSSRKS